MQMSWTWEITSVPYVYHVRCQICVGECAFSFTTLGIRQRDGVQKGLSCLYGLIPLRIQSSLVSVRVISALSFTSRGAGGAQWLERGTRDPKVPGSSPSTSGGRILFSTVFCADSYFGIRSTPVLPQQHVKDPGHSAKNAVAGYS